MTVLEEVENIISELDGSQDLVGKMDAVERLAILSYHLAHETANAHEDKNRAEFRYKSALTKYEATAQGSAAKNAVNAKHENIELYKNFMEAESVYRRMTLILAQTNVVIEQVRQSISYLKKEYHEGR